MANIYQTRFDGKFYFWDSVPCKVRDLEPASWDEIRRDVYK